MPKIRRELWTAPDVPTQRTGELRLTIKELSEADRVVILKSMADLIYSMNVGPHPWRRGNDDDDENNVRNRRRPRKR